MKSKYSFEISILEIILIGVFIGFYSAKTNNGIGDYLFLSAIDAVAYIVGFCFVYAIFHAMAEKMGEMTSFIILLISVFLFAIFGLPNKKYIDEDMAIDIAYEAGHKDAENNEYNDNYYKEVFQGKFNYAVK